jgi:hydrogenase expression/formation protein HypD
MIDRVFCVADAPWRALGVIPKSGLELHPVFRQFDALSRFGIELGEDEDHPSCRCGEVIQGKVQPDECSLFGTVCLPHSPVGPCMVSGEGTCSAWFKYRRSARRIPAGV